MRNTTEVTAQPVAATNANHKNTESAEKNILDADFHRRQPLPSHKREKASWNSCNPWQAFKKIVSKKHNFAGLNYRGPAANLMDQKMAIAAKVTAAPDA